jgi:predicted outer membrane repeat protein
MRRLTSILPLLLAFAAPTARAGSITVVNHNDGGAGSLRQAIQDVAPGDTIRFAPAVTGEIVLNDMAYQFTRTATVVGPGADLLALNGVNLQSLFSVTNGEVRISGLTFRNGKGLWGSAITSSDTLRVTRCRFEANRGTNGSGAISAQGVLEVTECTFDGNISDTGNGGAIATAANTTITGSTFKGNIGGALEVGSTLFLSNSTFFGNSNDIGGALKLVGTNQVVLDCTISGNSASVNGGGVYATNLPHFRNTIVAGNTGPNPDFSGTGYSEGFNLIGNPAGNSGFGIAGSHDQVGAVGNPIQPFLAPLGDYGGPTWTMPPQPGSPAIDQGNAFFDLDQRGRARGYDQVYYLNVTGGDGSDIGAYELRPGLRTVTTLADAGAGSLRQTVADLHPYDADSIKFAVNVRGTIALTTGVITCAKPGVIAGPNSWDLAVHGNNAGRVFVVNQNNTFEISGLTITGGRETEGIAVLALGNLTLRNCRLLGNHILPNEFALGGVVREFPPSWLVLENCTIANNTTGFGGGIFSGLGAGAGGSVTVGNCTFSGNTGPGIVSSGTATTVLNSTITNNNTMGADGGAIWHLQGPAVTVGGNILAGNLGPADVAGAFTSAGYNLVGKVGAATGLSHGVNHDRVGTAGVPIAPGLGPLSSNGGPGETHPVLVGSQALDKGRIFRLLDQRGAARYDDPAVLNEFDGSDIGAFERNPTSLIAVDPLPLETGLVLEAPRPSPAAGGVTSFASRIGSSGPVTLGIFDVAGRRVRSLVSAVRPAGSYTDPWDGRDDDGRTVRAGVYFSRLAAEGRAVSRNFVVLP